MSKKLAVPLKVIEVFKRPAKPVPYSFIWSGDDFAIVELSIPYGKRKIKLPAITHAGGIIAPWGEAKDKKLFPAQEALVYFNVKKMWQDWDRIKVGIDWYDLQKQRKRTHTIAAPLGDILHGKARIPQRCL